MMSKDLNDLAESFALFDNWEDRYRYLIELGGRLPAMDEALKTEDHLVKGCTSQVWLVADVTDDVFHFVADSDSLIVKGLIYLLDVAYQNKPVAEVKAMDIEESFQRLGLDQHLSPNRRNGFFAMVKRIQAIADNS